DVIGLGLCDIAGNVSHAHEVFFEDIRTPERALEFFTDTFHALYAGEVKKRCLGSAIAVTGPVDRRAGKLLSPVNLPGWSDLPLRKMLEEAFGIKVAVELFAEAILLGELFFNNHDIDSRIVLLWLDDGIGASISDKGRMNLDQTDRTSILGHQVVDFNGVPCSCGKRGCLIGYGSIPGFMRNLRLQLDIDDKQIAEATARFRGDPWRVSRDLELIELTKEDKLHDTFESYALEDLDRAYFAGLSNVINVLRSDRIVFSGRLAHRYREHFERIIGNVVETSMFFGGHKPRIEWKDLDGTELIRGGAARVFNEFINLVE
ncbi:MAG: ROK family protein, partial [Spirochaetales bacterium]|nr:ROK family protein [Spirochaetales bacterium]